MAAMVSSDASQLAGASERRLAGDVRPDPDPDPEISGKASSDKTILCQPCGMMCNGGLHYIDHCASKKHKKNLAPRRTPLTDRAAQPESSARPEQPTPG